MTIQQVIEAYYHRLFNQGEIQLVPELLHPEYVNHSPGSPDQPRHREAVAEVVLGLRRSFPDLHYTIEDLVIAGDVAAVRTTLRGTHVSGRRVEVPQMTMERFREGKIVAHHRVTDEAGLNRQLYSQG